MTTEAVIRLIKRETTEETNEFGAPVMVEREKAVYAMVGAVKRSEFYQASAAGLRPEITFEIYRFEYDGEKIVKYRDKRYNVIRTYPTKGERLEIICNDIAEEG